MVKQYCILLVDDNGKEAGRWLLPEQAGGRPAPAAQTLPPVINLHSTLAVDSKHFEVEIIVKAPPQGIGLIKKVMDAELQLTPLDILDDREEQDKKSLPEREQETLYYWLRGFSVPETADRMNIGAETVKTYRDKISEKAGGRSPLGLVEYALRHNLPGGERFNALPE
jgi:DNA-binding CsgD family transcriptional regulator